MRCNFRGCLGFLLAVCLTGVQAQAQYYYPEGQYQGQRPYQGQGARQYGDPQAYPGYQQGAEYRPTHPAANLQYDPRDAERILREQLARTQEQAQAYQQPQHLQQPQALHRRGETGYENYYGHRINDEGQVQTIMGEARYIASLIRQRNGKSFVVIDKRNFQFYLHDRNGRLLRIGPVAIGKGKTHVGAFETPVGVFPIKSKLAVDDWIRPDWYFIEENEPIPKNWEDRRVPGFFRYKLVFDGTRYIHYAEATGGRLTHGCLGLDWQDAEAVFHTLEVGSYAVIVDDGLLNRLARGEFPIQKPPATPVAAKPAPKPNEGATLTVRIEPGATPVRTPEPARSSPEERTFRDLW